MYWRIRKASTAGAIVRRNRCFDISREKGFCTRMLYFLLLTTIFLLVDLRGSSHNYYSDAFVVRERSLNIQQYQEPAKRKYDESDSRTAYRSGRETIREMNPSNFSPYQSVTSRNTKLFDGVITDQDLDQIVTPEQTNLDSTESIQSTPTTEVTSTQPNQLSNPPIEVVMPTNGTTSVSSQKATAMTTDGKATLLGKMKKKSIQNSEVPKPTANGGFTHTTTSRAKISAANKGKTPWNKGKPRSPEVKARIAAGVRAKNRQVFLKKLEDMGITEIEYEAKKKEDRRAKDADRRARRTANGGYRPTDETKKKISRILKEKHANGEVKKRAKPDPGKVRKGFKHSEETRKRISESLRKRWQDDEGFQKKMKDSINSRESARERISASLKKKWQEPEFRRTMMEKMSQRKSGKDAMSYDEEHRRKISDAMKRKWKDASYRDKTVSSMKKSAETRKITASPASLLSPKKSKASRITKSKSKALGIEEMKPMTVTDVSKRKANKKRLTRKKSTTKKVVKDDGNDSVTLVEAVVKPRKQQTKVKGVSEEKPPVEKKRKKKKKEEDGSVTRLKEERRDLFDLLYGDEDTVNDDDNAGNLLADYSSDSVDTLFGDEDLDEFDPYGLDDY